jgi:hypothetical protein
VDVKSLLKHPGISYTHPPPPPHPPHLFSVWGVPLLILFSNWSTQNNVKQMLTEFFSNLEHFEIADEKRDPLFIALYLLIKRLTKIKSLLSNLYTKASSVHNK